MAKSICMMVLVYHNYLMYSIIHIKILVIMCKVSYFYLYFSSVNI